MDNKLVQKARDMYFVAVGVLMYYFLNEIINLGLFVTYRHAFALVLAASAFLCFLFKPKKFSPSSAEQSIEILRSKSLSTPAIGTK